MPALSEIGIAVEELHDQAASPSGLVRINCDANAAEQVLMPLLTRFMKLQPQCASKIRPKGDWSISPKEVSTAASRGGGTRPGEMVAIRSVQTAAHRGGIARLSRQCAASRKSVGSLASPVHPAPHGGRVDLSLGVSAPGEECRRGDDRQPRGRPVPTSSGAALDDCGLAYVTRWMARSTCGREIRQALARVGRRYPGLYFTIPNTAISERG